MIHHWSHRFSSVCAILALLGAAGSIKPASAAQKIAISFAGVNPRQTPLWIAQEQGLFAKHGVEADVVFIRTGPIQVAAVSSGATQVAYSGPASILGATSAGSDLRMIASFTNKLTYTIVARPEIRRPKICAPSASACKPSAARFGWARCWVWSILASNSGATISAF